MIKRWIAPICLIVMVLSVGTSFAQERKTISQERIKTPAKRLTNELIWASGEFRSEWVGGVLSMNDGIHYTSLDWSDGTGRVVKYAYKTGEEVSVIATSLEVFPDGKNMIEDYQFSADESKLLVKTQTESIYRHSSKANYFIYTIATKKTTPLTDFSKGKQRLADFSPNGSKVAFVRDNNLFVHDTENGLELQVTTDGVMNAIINGATDWVYEEEFGFDKGFYWSPDGNRLAYYRFDESNVKEFQMAIYGDLYPEQYTFKYPKAGEENAKVRVYIFDLNTNQSRRVDVEGDDIYIPRIKWSQNSDKLCVLKLNRHQNHLEFHFTDLSQRMDGKSIPTKLIYEERSKTYIEINDNLTFLKDGKRFLWNSSKDGYNHLYLFDLNGDGEQQLTSGTWDVIDFLGLDEKNGLFYYTSSQVSPMEQHVYVKGIQSRVFNKLSTLSGTNSANFSKTFAYYINYHSDANTPYYITLHDRKGKEIRVLKDNAPLKTKLADYQLSAKTFFTFKNRNGIDLNCWMIKPKDFDPSKSYPVYVNIYGGPGHNTVTDSWGGSNLLWHQMLAQMGYIVVSCDPHGTMYRGRNFLHSTYQQLGKLETEDFIDFAKYLGNQSYIDADRIGIQGWSYGGYMTSLCMTKGADQYKMGIAVAPVTNWRYYDSIYTERFMRTPQENANGYDDNSPINHVDKLEGPYLLVHGSADDNVHYQNTMEMISALVDANKQFDLFIYPNKNHGIYGGNTRLHLFTKMTNFVTDNL